MVKFCFRVADFAIPFFITNTSFWVEVMAVLTAPFIIFHPYHLCSYFHEEIRFFLPVREKISAVFVIHPVEISVPTTMASFISLSVGFPTLVAVFVVLWIFCDFFYWVLHLHPLWCGSYRTLSGFCLVFRKTGNSSVSFLLFDNVGQTFFLPFLSAHYLVSLSVEGFPVFCSAYRTEWLISI